MSMLEFDNFFKINTKDELGPKLIPVISEEDVYVEMAEGGRAGGGRGGYIRLEDDDIQYLYQFLPEDWHRALQWRYGIGLMLYSHEKNSKGLGQSADYENRESGNISFNSNWLQNSSDYIDPKISAKTSAVKNVFFENPKREYKNVKFGFNNVFKKLSDVSKYDFDMGETDFSRWPELPPSNAGYKPLTKENAARSMNKWIKAHGLEHQHPENYQDLMNQHLMNHPEVEKDEETGLPSHSNYSPLSPQHHLPITSHNYHDSLYRKLNKNFVYPSRYTQWHVGAAGGQGYDPGKDPHQQGLHPQGGQPTGQTAYKRTQYSPNMQSIQAKHGAMAPQVAQSIQQAHDADLYPITKGQAGKLKVAGRDVDIHPEDVHYDQHNHAAHVASQAVGRTINAQDIVVKPIDMGTGKDRMDYDIYEIFGLHRAMLGKERSLEHLFPEQIHNLAREIFVKTNDKKYGGVNGGAEGVFNAVYGQRFAPQPKYVVNPDSEKPYPLKQIDLLNVRTAYTKAGRSVSEDDLLSWDKTGLLKTIKAHKQKATGDPDVALGAILTSGFMQTYSLSGGPEIYEKNSEGKWEVIKDRKVFVPLLHPGQALPSQKQRGKSIAVGAIGNSAVGESKSAFFGSSPADDNYTIPGTNKQINRNEEFFSAAEEGRLPDKRLFNPLNRPDPEPEEINRAHHFSYPELAKWHGKEIRKIKKKDVELNDRLVNVQINGKDHRILASVEHGVKMALKSIESNNPTLAALMEKDIGNLYQWSMIQLRNLIDHPQFWYNKDYEDYLKGQEEERASGDLGIPSEQSDVTLKDTGYMWRAQKVRDFLKTYAQRRWGTMGTRRSQKRDDVSGSGSQNSTDEGTAILDTVAKNDRLMQQTRDEEKKRRQGEKKAPELLGASENTPANAQSSFFVAMQYRKWLESEAKEGRYHESDIIQMDNKISASILRALMMKAIHSLNDESGQIIPSAREILQLSPEDGGFGLSKDEAMKLDETDPRYEEALMKQENMAARWAGEKAPAELARREEMDDPTAETDLLPKEFITNYADRPIDANEIIKINSIHDKQNGLRQTPHTNQAEKQSLESGELDHDEIEEYRQARQHFKNERLTLSDSDAIEGIVDDIVNSDSLTAMTAFRDHLLDDLASNYYLKSHLDEESLEKIYDSITAIEEAKIDPEFREKVKERLSFAENNSPRVYLHGDIHNPYEHEMRELAGQMNPDLRERIEENLIKPIKALSPKELLNSDNVAKIIEKSKGDTKIHAMVPFAVLQAIHDMLLNSVNAYLYTQNADVKKQLAQITDLFDRVYSAGEPALAKKKLLKRFRKIIDIASRKARTVA